MCPDAVSPQPSLRRRVPGRTPSLLLTVVLAVLVALLADGAPARAAAPVTPSGTRAITVRGVVRDEQGAAVPRADVRLNALAQDFPTSGRQDWHTTQTDEQGHYELRDVATTATGGAEVASLRAEAPGFAGTNHPDFGPAFVAAGAGPMDADFVLVRRDVTLRGRLRIRGTDDASGGSVLATAAEIDPRRNPGNAPEFWSADVQPDGTWSMRIPPVPVRLEARSTHGLPTRWPDLPTARWDAPVIRTVHGDVRDDLDLSMRQRLPYAAIDEFGELQEGVVPRTLDDPPVTARYPRDAHRSVTSVVGPRIAVGPVVNDPSSPLGVPADDPVTITRMPIPVQATVTNDGDDVLWLDDVRFEGDRATCDVTYVAGPCEDAFVLPHSSRPLMIVVDSTRYAPVYRTTLVLRSSAPGGETRIPVSVRNLATADYDTDDPSHPVPLGLVPYLSPVQLAQALANGNLRIPAAVARSLAVRSVTVTRGRVTATFPGAGTATITIARARPRAPRRAVAWRTVQRVRLTSARAGRRSKAIRSLPAARYRLRTVTRIAGHRPRTTTTYRVVRRAPAAASRPSGR